jgi:FkbM family methyltransferase
MFPYIKKLKNPKAIKNFIAFLFIIKNPFILILAVFFPKKRILHFVYKKDTVSLVYRNIYDLAIIFEIFITGVYPVKFILNSKVMADIGGHCGYTAVWASLLNPDLKIHSYEPDKENAEIFEENIKLNNLESKISLHNYGMGLKESDVHFYIYQNASVNSIVLHKGLKPKTEVYIKIKAALVELEKISPDFIKVDIEGMEDEIIAPILSLSKKPTYLSMEFSDNKERTSKEAIEIWIKSVVGYENFIDDIIVNSEIK